MKNSLSVSFVALVACCQFAFAQPGEVYPEGVWEEPWFDFGGNGLEKVGAVHLIHLHTGKVIAIALTDPDPCEPACGGPPNFNCLGRVYLWTPPIADGTPGDPGTFQNIYNCHFLFCCGHTTLADGRVLTIGGHWSHSSNLGPPYTDLFHPAVEAWNFPAAPGYMAQGRWYPTGTTLPDGKVLATSGNSQGANGPVVLVPELFDPAALDQQSAWTPLLAATREQKLYPWMFVLPDGNVVDAGHGESRILMVGTPPYSATWAWGILPLPNPTWPVQLPTPPGHDGSAVMYEPGKIMKCGGWDPAVATTFVVDLNDADPNDPPPWMVSGDMNVARLHHNLVILPDGKVLALGGAKYWNDDPLPNPLPPCSTGTFMNVCPVFDAEMYDPVAGTWTLLAHSNLTQPRMYHSTAMLLPDGRVVSAGGNTFRTAQIFRPPYINPSIPRPIINAAPTFMQYGQQYTIHYNPNGGPPATRACLIRLAAVTHGFDQSQRRVPLDIAQLPIEPGPNQQATVSAPLNANIAPPGYYMLFILNEYARNYYAPCTMAKYVRVGPS